VSSFSRLGKTARAQLERRVRGLAPARQFRLELARRTIEDFAAGRPIRVLDAGCEEGLLTLTLARRNPTWSVVGVDVNDAALEVSRRAASAEGVANVEYLHVDITRPFASRTYDVVAAIESLPQIADDEAALTELVAALKDDGLLVLHVPERHWRPVLRHGPTFWKGELRHGYDELELRAALEAAGVHDLDVRPTVHAPLQLAEEIRHRLKNRTLKVRAFVYPLFTLAVRLELGRLTAGTARAFYIVGRRRAGPPVADAQPIRGSEE